MSYPLTTYVRALPMWLRYAPVVLAILAVAPAGVVPSPSRRPGLSALDMKPESAHSSPDPAELLMTALTRCGTPLSGDERRHIADSIVRTAGRHGYDPLFVQAMVEVESTCSPTARSRAGALGLIQVKPSTARAVAARVGMRWHGPQQLMSPAINLEIGVRYLAELEERFDDPYLAVAAYNMGPTRVAGMDPLRARSSRYVRKIMSRYEGLLQEHLATPS